VRILVTGATGFIGSRLCHALAGAGHQVRALHRAQSSLRVLSDIPVELAQADIQDPQSLDACIEGEDAVIHCAGELGPRASRLPPEAIIASHVLGTRNMLQASLRRGVKRFVYTSSSAALGVPSLQPSAETTPLMTESHRWNCDSRLWPYGYAKHMAEQEVHNAVNDGLDAVIVNPSVVIGAGDIHQASNAFIVFMALRGLPIAVHGGVNVVHIDDVLQGHLAALERGRIGQRYILGGENLSIPRLLVLTAEIVHRRPPRWTIPNWVVNRASPILDVLSRLLGLPIPGTLLRLAGRYFFYDVSKARDELGLALPKPYHKAAAESAAWYAENGYLGH
jgi:dihydroflavonol-4-reductase